MRQKPFLGRASPGPDEAAHSALQTPSWIGEGRHRGVQGTGKQKSTEAEKRGYLGKKGREQKGWGEGMKGERRAQKGSKGHTCSLCRQSEILDPPRVLRAGRVFVQNHTSSLLSWQQFRQMCILTVTASVHLTSISRLLICDVTWTTWM